MQGASTLEIKEVVNKVIVDVLKELESATRKFGAFNSGHEGYAVILEELDELWEAIKDKNQTIEDQREEAIQVAAMAIRYILDICIGGGNESL